MQEETLRQVDAPEGASTTTAPNGPTKTEQCLNETEDDNTLLSIIDKLPEFNMESIEESIRHIESGTSSKLASAANLKPHINFEKGYVLLPNLSDIDPDDAPPYTAAYRLAGKLKLTVKLIEYSGKIKQMLKSEWNYAAGMMIGVEDVGRKINIKAKKNDIERGRTFLRAQQIIGYASSLGIHADLFKKNHEFWGNNPGESLFVNKRAIPVNYSVNEIAQLFSYESWRDELAKVLVQLMRRSHTLVQAKIMSEQIDECLEPESSFIQKHSLRTVIVTPKSGKKAAVTKEQIPHKPRRNALLLKTEQDFIEKMFSCLFKEPIAHRNHGKESWTEYLMRDKNAKILREAIDRNMNRRTEFLARFSALTTTRLKEIRKYLEKPTIRKRDITSDNLDAWLKKRKSPIKQFASEISKLNGAKTGKPLVMVQLQETLGEIEENQALERIMDKDVIYGEVLTEEKSDLPKNKILEKIKTKKEPVQTKNSFAEFEEKDESIDEESIDEPILRKKIDQSKSGLPLSPRSERKYKFYKFLADEFDKPNMIKKISKVYSTDPDRRGSSRVVADLKSLIANGSIRTFADIFEELTRPGNALRKAFPVNELANLDDFIEAVYFSLDDLYQDSLGKGSEL